MMDARTVRPRRVPGDEFYFSPEWANNYWLQLDREPAPWIARAGGNDPRDSEAGDGDVDANAGVDDRFAAPQPDTGPYENLSHGEGVENSGLRIAILPTNIFDGSRRESTATAISRSARHC
jgi:hypothetical protein